MAKPIKISRNNLIALGHTLPLLQNKTGVNFKTSYNILKNVDLIESERQSLEKMEKEIGKEFSKIEPEVQELKLKYCDKDEKGKPKINNGTYSFDNIENRNKFEEEAKKLSEREDVKKILEKRTIKNNEFQGFLNEIVEFPLRTIKIKDLNLTDELTINQIIILKPILEDFDTFDQEEFIKENEKEEEVKKEDKKESKK